MTRKSNREKALEMSLGIWQSIDLPPVTAEHHIERARLFETYLDYMDLTEDDDKSSIVLNVNGEVTPELVEALEEAFKKIGYHSGT